MKSHTILTKKHLFCIGELDPHEIYEISNSGVGGTNDYLYVLSGGGFANADPIYSGFTDMRKYHGGKITYKAGELGCRWVAVNSTADEKFDAQLVENDTISVTVNDGEYKLILGIRGVSVANGKNIPALGYAIVPVGKPIDVSASGDAVCLVLTRV